MPATSTAQAALTGVEFSTDATAVIGGVALTPENIALDDLAGGVAIITGAGYPFAVPAGTGVDAFERLPNGDTLFSFDVAPIFVFPPSAVIRVSPLGVVDIVFGSIFQPLPPGTNVDAVAQSWRDGDLLLSFTDALELGGVALEDEDLAWYDPATGDVTLAFDGSAAGIGAALDLDAVDVSPTGELWLSFDDAGAVPGAAGPVAFDDEDILAYDPDTGSFELVYDGSAQFAGWEPVDLDAFSNPDSDGDGFADLVDNCPFFAQASLLDADGDGRGDECPRLTSSEFSTDAAVVLGGTALTAEDVALDDLAGGVAITGTGALIAPGSNVDAFERLPGGAPLFSVAVSDGLRDPGSVYFGSVAIFNRELQGLPEGTDVDAVALAWSDQDLLLSFADPLVLGGLALGDEDLVWYDSATGDVTLAFDGSAAGIDAALDLDGADVSPFGELWLSFDGPGVVDGVAFDDEDVLAFDPDTGDFELVYDGSAQFAAWTPVDLDAFSNPDSDGDGFFDAADTCPYHAQRALRDTDRNGRGDECECGDQNGDGTVDVKDIVQIRNAIFTPALATALCDANGDGVCNVRDIVAVNYEIFSVGSTSTCSRYPVPGPGLEPEP